MIKKVSVVIVLLAVTSLLFIYYSCKSCKKEDKAVTTDTTTVSSAPINTINLPHADTSVIPILSKILDETFDASSKRDYNKLGSLLVYRGPDETRYGSVFNAKNSYEKKVLAVTADVFNKWNKNIESREYARVFSLPQQDGTALPVLEVFFVSPKFVDRKFFLFMEISGDFKVAEITSSLE